MMLSSAGLHDVGSIDELVDDLCSRIRLYATVVLASQHFAIPCLRVERRWGLPPVAHCFGSEMSPYQMFALAAMRSEMMSHQKSA